MASPLEKNGRIDTKKYGISGYQPWASIYGFMFRGIYSSNFGQGGGGCATDNFFAVLKDPSWKHLEKGVPKNLEKRSAELEVAFLTKCRKAVDVTELVPMEKVLQDAGDAVNQKELTLQKTRQYLHQAHTYLEEALLEGEEL